MNTLQIEAELAEQYGYAPLPSLQSEAYRNLFLTNIPEWLKLGGDPQQMLCTKSGFEFATGYRRIVVGDYGAFIEIDANQIQLHKITVKRGQEYRINDAKYSRNVKYHWYTTLDGSDIKIYKQVRKVKYADYKPKMYYVSVHEVANERDISL